MDVPVAALCAALALALLAAGRERSRLAAGLAEAREELARLSGLALHDPLTGLPNRLLLGDRLRHALQAQGRRGGSVGVLFLDLDGFKAVNDAYGHAAGDQVLAAVGHRLRTSLRAGDTAARLSGDEFVVVCEGVADRVALLGAAARLEAALSVPFLVDGRRVCLGVSIGSALHDPAVGADEPPSQVAARLLADADTGMYDVKRGRQLQLAELEATNHLAALSAPRGRY